ncbi:hypothetical protein SNE40_022909 [Patella caerulea]|uniref:Autophagy-related protein 27 n=1 Tax=Patella caerulea TaxID=87958 RepID=A0AAN8G940_PATCE
MVLRNTKSLFFLLSVFISCMKISNVGAADACVKKSACSCENSEGTIDLTPLVGSPKFKDVQDEAGSYYFSYNPCTKFTESGCTNVAGCQTDMTNFYSIGTQDSATFKVDATNGLYIEYDATTDVKRTLQVYLKCDQTEEGKLDVKGEFPAGSAIYEMTLTSKYACASGGGGPTVTVSVSLSTGSIMVIIFFAVLVVYVIAGISFQRFARKASGKEMAPNYGFWSSMPGLVKDGVLFTVKCGKVGSSYDNI